MSTAIEKVHEMVDNAILNLVLHFPTYAQFIVRVGYGYKDFGEAIACTDGRTIFINDRLIAEINADPIKTNSLTNEKVDCTIGKEEMMFVLCHEAMHLLTATVGRAERLGIPQKIGMNDVKNQFKQMLWNMATDYAINYLLVNNEENWEKRPIGKMLQGALYEDAYAKKTAEEIYHLLLKENEDTIENMSNNGLSYVLDIHLPIDDEQIKSSLSIKIAEVFGSRTNGTSDSSIDRVIKEAMKPLPFNWRNALSKYIRGWIRENYTWNKPSRAGVASGLILPSSGTSPCMHLAIAVDTSGSISNEELQAMFNHVTTILNAFNNFKIDLWCCGSRVYHETFKTYTRQNRNTVKDFKIMSDGGNDMRENFTFIKDHYKGNFPDVFLCLTDGFDPVDGDNEVTCPCPVVWLIIDHPDFVSPSKLKSVVYPYVVDLDKNGG